MIKLVSCGCKCLCAAVLLSILGSSVLAQTGSTGAISGTVTDSSGAVVPNVTVTVTSNTGQVRTATTRPDGSYSITLLPPTDYRVKFEAGGFQIIEVPSATVNVTETRVLNEILAVSSASQQVTVQGEVETVQTTSASVGSLVPGELITDIPLATRNYTNLLSLSAGANATVQNATGLGKGWADVMVNGSDLRQNNYMMDGINIENIGSINNMHETGGFGSIAIPTPDAIQEFKIQTAAYDAGYGTNPGGNMNVVTKSGTNAWHGSAYEFFRNTVLNANDFFLNATGKRRGVLDQNDFGGTIGGPVKKDKLFFFVSGEEFRQKNGYSPQSLSTGVILPPLPTGNRGTCPAGATSLSQCDAATQAFVAALGANINATSSNAESIANSAAGSTSSVPVGTQVAANGSNINPVAVQELQLKLPGGAYYVPGSGTSNYSSPQSFSAPALYAEHSWIGNWDYIINQKNTLSGRYYYSIEPMTTAFQGTAVNGAPVWWVPGLGAHNAYANHVATMRLTSILSANLVNDAHVSYERNWIDLGSLGSFTDPQVGMTPISPGNPIMTEINIANFMTIGNSVPSTLHSRVNQFIVGDAISWSHGKHTIRVGFEGYRGRWYYKNPSLAIGALNINSFADYLVGLPGCVQTGAACIASQAAGTTNGTAFSNIASQPSSAEVTGDNSHAILQDMMSAFIQDDFKVNQRLTLNLGLRWEFDPPPTAGNGSWAGAWASLINTQPVPGSGCVYNGFQYGAVGGTGCSFAGFMAPANYNVPMYPLPQGIYQSNKNYVQRNGPIMDDFAPRFGFAWQPLSSNNRLVVRGGAGYFYDWLTAGKNVSTYAYTYPGTVGISGSGTQIYASSLAHPFNTPPLGWQPRWVNFANGTSSNLSLNNNGPYAQDLLTPLVYEYSLNVQYEFLRNWVTEIGYVGSHGIHQQLENNGNAAVDFMNGARLANPANPINGLTNSTTSGGTSTGAAGPALRVPYLGFAPTQGFIATTGSEKYNSLQVTVRRAFSHGLSMQAAYTWARAFELAPQQNPAISFANNIPVINVYEPNVNYHPQRLTLHYSWDLPFGHHEGLLNKVVNGWTVSGVTTIQNGLPMTITDGRGGTVLGSPLPSTAQLSGTASVATSGSMSQRVATRYLDPAAFASTPLASTLAGCASCTGTLPGNSSMGSILGPGQSNWDISLFKTTRVGGLREAATLQFRAEFYNAFNHPQFSNPALAFNVTQTFGTITSLSVNPRLIQFSLKYSF